MTVSDSRSEPPSSGGLALWSAVYVSFAASAYLRVWAHAYRVGKIDQLRWSHLAIWTFSFLLVIGAVLTIYWLVRRKLPQRVVAASAAALAVIQVWSIPDSFVAASSSEIARGARSIASLLGAVAIVSLVHRLGDEPFTPHLFVILALMFAAPAAPGFLDLILTEVEDGAGDADSHRPFLESPERMPDVVVIIVDAYPRSDVLQEDFAFNNAPFEGFLARSGFEILHEATSPYSGTRPSVAGLLDLQYPIDSGVVDRDERRTLTSLMSGRARMFTELDAAGYQIRYYENAWTAAGCGEVVDVCVITSSLDELDHAVIKETPLPWLIPSLRISPWVTSGVKQAAAFTRHSGREDSIPSFSFVHLLLPHPPFQLGQDCSTYHTPTLDGYAFFGPDQGVRVAGFIAQLHCTNRLVSDIVATLPRDAAVLITGDHGTEFLRPVGLPSSSFGVRHLRERFGVFTAIRLPSRCPPVPQDATTINAARRLHACVTGKSLPDLPAAFHYLEAVPFGHTATDVTGVVEPMLTSNSSP